MGELMRGRPSGPKKKTDVTKLLEKEVRSPTGLRRDMDILVKMFARTEKLYKPSVRESVNLTGRADPTQPLSLGLLSRRTWVKGIEKYRPSLQRLPRRDRKAALRPFSLDGGLSVTRSITQVAWSNDCATFLQELRALLRERPQPSIVLVNELGYPWRDNKRQDAFQHEIQRLVDEHRFMLVAGTYHSRNGHNYAALFVPGKTELIRHAKRHPALAVGECIIPPRSDMLQLYEVDGRTMTILVCVDAFVPSLMMRLARFNHRTDEDNLHGRRIDIVLVPSFYPGNKRTMMREACEHLSILADCVVVFVNCSASVPRMSLFVSGKDCSDEVDITHRPKSERSVIYSLPQQFMIDRQKENIRATSKLLREIREGIVSSW